MLILLNTAARRSETMEPASWLETAQLMPWTTTRYPASMRHLSGPVREKAIEIANALLGEGMEEGMAIRVAIARARQWAQRRGLGLRDDVSRED